MSDRLVSWAAAMGGCLVLLATATASQANAQTATSFDALQRALKAGTRLTITEQSGGATNGRFAGLANGSLHVVVESGRTVDFPESSVARIEELRSRKAKGALIGFAAGFVSGLVAVALAPESHSCCGPSTQALRFPVAGFFGGIGAGIGAIVGRARPAHRLVYQAP